MIVCWDEEAWDDYVALQKEDKRMVRKIHTFIRDIKRHGYDSGGQDELLRYLDGGWHSKRIDKKNRFVYRILEVRIEIFQCRNHYQD